MTATTAELRRRSHRTLDRDRLALLIFVVGLTVGGVMLLAVLGRYRWFLIDEWDLLADRELGDLNDWFRPHGGHWVTLPFIAYRLMWVVSGFNYLGYQLLIVSTHVTAIVLLRVVMRRAGVDPWIATVVALSLLLFGSGEDNIIWGFQITLVGALVFGLVQLLLLDHPGPLDRRDWLSLGAGLLALLCSGVGVAMVLAAGVASLAKRNWRVALFHVAPLGAIYAVWWAAARPNPRVSSEFGTIASWNANAVVSAVHDLGYFAVVGLALAAVFVVGIMLFWIDTPRSERLARLAVPGSLLVAGLIFLNMTWYTRAGIGVEQAASSRYVYILVACWLPLLAVAMDAIVRRWRLALAPLVALVLLGVPGNIVRFGETSVWNEQYFNSQKRFVLALPRAKEAELVDPSTQPNRDLAPGLTIGWLREQLAEGRMPEPTESPLPNMLRLSLAVAQSPGEPPGSCEPFFQPRTIETSKGDVIGFRNQPVFVELVQGGRPLRSSRVVFNPDVGERLTIGIDGLRLRLTPAPLNSGIRAYAQDAGPAELCR